MSKSEEPGIIPLLRTRSALDITQDWHDAGQKVDENAHRSKSALTSMYVVDESPPPLKVPTLDVINLEDVTNTSPTEKASARDGSSDIGSQISITSYNSSKNKHSPASRIPIAIKSSVTRPPSTPRLNTQISSKTKIPISHVKDVELQYNTKVKRLNMVKKNMQEKQKRVTDLYNMISSMREDIFVATSKELPIEEVEFKICTSEKDLSACNKHNIKQSGEEAKKIIVAQLETLASSLLDTSYQLINESCDIFHDVLGLSEINMDYILSKIEKRKEELREIENKVIIELNANETIINNVVEKISYLTTQVSSTENEKALNLLKKKVGQTEKKLKETEIELEIELENTLHDKEKYKRSDAKISEIMQQLESLANNLSDEKANMGILKKLEVKSQQNLNIFYVELEGLNQQKMNYENKIEGLTNHIQVLEKQWESKLAHFLSANEKLQENLNERKNYANAIKKSSTKVDLRVLFNVALYFLYDIVTSDMYF